MKIGIVGSGRLGCSLARAILEKNQTSSNSYEVAISTREMSDDKIRKVQATVGKAVQILLVSNIAQISDLIFLAIPWEQVTDVVNQIKANSYPTYKNKIFVDCTNPLASDKRSLINIKEGSAGQHIAAQLGSKVVKSFNTFGYESVLKPVHNGISIDNFVAGDDLQAKKEVIQISNLLGFNTIDVGGIRNSHYLEIASVLWLRLFEEKKFGLNFGFKLVGSGVKK